METFLPLAFAFAVSLDSAVVGFGYGIRSLRMPFSSLLAIALATFLAMGTAASLGARLALLFSDQLARWIGAVILFSLGIWILFFASGSPGNREREMSSRPLKIIQRPEAADLDRSGAITGIEAFFLATVLAVDAFGAGIGAGIAGLAPLPLAAFAALTGAAFLYGGIRIGARLHLDSPPHLMRFLSAAILIGLAFTRVVW